MNNNIIILNLKKMNNIDDDWENFLEDNNCLFIDNLQSTKNINKPKFSDLYISTKTKICFLNNEIDIYNVFWKIDLINYDDLKEGIIKKQIKVSCINEEQVEILEKNLKLQKNNIIKINKISKIDNPQGRIKFKDVRKISVGICKKDLLNSRSKEKSAFYNCFVVIIRLLFNDSFREIHVKVFNTGKLEIPGIQSDEMLYKILNYLKDYFKVFYPDIDYNNNSKTVLINSNFNCGYYIDRDKLFNILRYKYNINSCYDPCSYPGIQSHFYYDINDNIDNQNGLQKNNKNQSKISFMIFRTGSILIVGKCEENIIYYIYNFIKKIINDEFELISKQENYIKKQNICKKNKRKNILFIEC